MDRKDSMFEKNIYQRRTGSMKISLLLNYTEDYFVCGEDNYKWTLHTLEQLWVRAVSHNAFIHSFMKNKYLIKNFPCSMGMVLIIVSYWTKRKYLYPHLWTIW